jgi:hypothetical protein
MNQQLEAGVTVDANKLLRQRDAERLTYCRGIEPGFSIPNDSITLSPQGDAPPGDLSLRVVSQR